MPQLLLLLTYRRTPRPMLQLLTPARCDLWLIKLLLLLLWFVCWLKPLRVEPLLLLLHLLLPFSNTQQQLRDGRLII
jgi:hypothetical protein